MLGTHTGGAAVASLAVSWCASAALSAPIVFDNTGGQFQWPTIDRTPGPPLPAQVVVLDVTKPASAQGPLPTQPGPPASLPPGAFAYEINFPPGNLIYGHTGIAGGSGAAVAVDPPRTINSNPPGQSTTTTPLSALAVGSLVGPTLTFADAGTTAVLNRTFGPTSVFPDHGFVGTRLTLADGVHYGFIELDLPRNEGRALRWGYETTPNAPFVLPEPTVALPAVACFAFGLTTHRRRKPGPLRGKALPN